MPRTQALKKVNVAALMKKVDRLLSESVPELEEAILLLRQILEAEPDHLWALHSLNWALDSWRRVAPLRWERELEDEHWRIRDHILELTRGTKPGGKLSDAQRARSLALSQWAEEVVKGRPGPAQLDAVESALEEAHGLRELPDHARARRGLEAWRLLAGGKKGYEELLARIEASPELRAFGAEGDDDPLNFQGLQGAFSDEGFLAWLRKQKPAARPKGAKGKALDEGLLLAAGLDASTSDYGPGFRDAGRVGRVLALRALGANLEEARDDEKQGALHLAAKVDDAALVTELFRLGLSPHVTIEGKATALHAAAEHDAVSCIPGLVQGGVPVDALDSDGRTALFLARRPEVARALLDAGADPNAGKGWTPLHLHARFREHGPVIEVLLQAGADASRKDANRRTPAQEALDHKNPHLAELMGAKAPSGGAGRLDVQPLLDELARRKKALLGAWYYEDEDVEAVERVLKSLALGGTTSWDQAAAALGGSLPWTAMAVVELARAVLPREEKTPSFSKAPRFVRGDLTVKKDVNLSGPLLVTGDLTVEGVLRNAGPEGLLVVGGSLRATGVDTSGEVLVGGDLEARIVWGHSNDHSLRVGKGLKADVVIEDDHDVQARVKARHHFERDAFDASDAALKKVFVRDAFTSEGLDRDKLFNLLRKDRAVLASR